MVPEFINSKELEEQAIALKWYSDVRSLKKALKFESPRKLQELREAQYFAEDYLPKEGCAGHFPDLIAVSFMQDMPASNWQTSALLNAKRILNPWQQEMLRRWTRERRKLFSKEVYFAKQTPLSALGVVRMYALLHEHFRSHKEANKTPAIVPPVLSKKLLIQLVDMLPFFETSSAWNERAQKRFEGALVSVFHQELSHKPKEISTFLTQQVMRAVLTDENPKRAEFKVGLWGKVADRFHFSLDKKRADALIKHLEVNKRTQLAKSVKKAFHVDTPSISLRLLKAKSFLKKQVR